jgi:hypothetical protein
MDHLLRFREGFVSPVDVALVFMAGSRGGQSESSLETMGSRTLRGRETPSFWATSSNPASFLKHSISAAMFRNPTFCHVDVAS